MTEENNDMEHRFWAMSLEMIYDSAKIDEVPLDVFKSSSMAVFEETLRVMKERGTWPTVGYVKDSAGNLMKFIWNNGHEESFLEMVEEIRADRIKTAALAEEARARERQKDELLVRLLSAAIEDFENGVVRRPLDTLRGLRDHWKKFL